MKIENKREFEKLKGEELVNVKILQQKADNNNL